MEPTKNHYPEELKTLIRGKSPEEIARTVESYYEEKYRRERLFSDKGIVVVVLFIISVALLFFIFYKLFLLPRITPGHNGGSHLEQPVRQD